jgi:branched-chain amino acid transport system permease protein
MGTGGVYALVAMGYNLVFSSTGVFNLAQGDLVSVGGFLAFALVTSSHVNVLLAVCVAIAAVGALGLIQELITVDPYLRRKGDGFGWLIATLGASVAIENGLQLIWGSEPHPVPPLVSHATFYILGAPVAASYVLVFVIAVAIAVGIDVWTARTMIGQAWRATAEDREAAQARGINVRAVGIAAFVLAAMLSGLAGFLVAPITEAQYNAGAIMSLQGFVAIAIGGFGAQRGALVGSLLLGIAEAEASLIWSPGYQSTTALVLLMLVLVVRPSGLFGRVDPRVA